MSQTGSRIMQEYRTLEDGTSEHKTLENEMIEYCSPTLAGLKTANMFSHKYTRMEQLLNEIEDKNCKPELFMKP